jgi:sortase A
MRARVLFAASERKLFWRAGQYSFWILGIASLGMWGYSSLARVLYQAYESRSFDRAAGSSAPLDRSAPAVELRSNDGIASIGRVDRAPASEPPFSTEIIGRLSVPKLHLSAMVREGIDANTLRLAVGHIPTTALPGQAGNVGVAGHRDTFFRGLKDLKAKDVIQFSTPNGRFNYEVESLKVVEADNVGVLAPSGENSLTMVTCYPFSYVGPAPKRFVVTARQVSPQVRSPATVEAGAKRFDRPDPLGAAEPTSELLWR